MPTTKPSPWRLLFYVAAVIFFALALEFDSTWGKVLLGVLVFWAVLAFGRWFWQYRSYREARSRT